MDDLCAGDEIIPGIHRICLKSAPGRKIIHQGSAWGYLLVTPSELPRMMDIDISASFAPLHYIVHEPPDTRKFAEVFAKAMRRVFETEAFENKARHVLFLLEDDVLKPVDPEDYATANLAHQGMPASVISLITKARILSEDEVHALIIPERTLRDRRRHEKPLSQEESDRLLRVLRVIEHAERVFEDRAKALRWLRKPKRRLAGKTPMAILDTDAGVSSVVNWLDQIEYGVAA